MIAGGYPRIYARGLTPQQWHANYVTTYLERDVRTVKAVSDLPVFQRFLKMCAARSGQILNLSSLGTERWQCPFLAVFWQNTPDETIGYWRDARDETHHAQHNVLYGNR